MEIGIRITVNKDTDILSRFNDAISIGIRSCQLMFWNPAVYSDDKASEILNAAGQTGMKISAIFGGWSGPRIWNLTEGPSTIGLIPAKFRDTRVKELYCAGRFASKIGVSQVLTHVGFLPDDENDDDYKAVIKALRPLCIDFRKCGLTFLFETGQEHPETLLRAIHDLNVDNVGINMDAANLILYGMAEPVQALKLFGGYVRNVHCKDGLYPTKAEEMGAEVQIGTGGVDFRGLISTLKSFGYDGPLTIEREITSPNLRDEIVAAKSYLESLL